MGTEEMLTHINQQDQTVASRVSKEIPNITKVVDVITHSLSDSGRLFYVGAGTSGRMAILDAVECPPTFGIRSDMVQALIAGGDAAVANALEGAEDDELSGRDDLIKRLPTSNDVVIGIAASGRTPYVIGALKAAREAGAQTVSLTCNKSALMNNFADYQINVEVGPEVIVGSSRMKAGTAQKLVLNMISTAVMTKLGKVYKNMMVDVKPANEKLVARSKQIIVKATDCSMEEADNLFELSGQQSKVAIVMYHCDTDRKQAESLLERHKGIVAEVLENEGE